MIGKWMGYTCTPSSMLSLINISDSLDILMRESGSLSSCPGVHIYGGMGILVIGIESREQDAVYFVSSEIFDH